MRKFIYGKKDLKVQALIFYDYSNIILFGNSINFKNKTILSIESMYRQAKILSI